MWRGGLIVDGVVHGYDWSRANRSDAMTYDIYEGALQYFFQAHTRFERSDYLLEFDKVTTRWTAEDLARGCIDESDLDMLVYHEVQIPGVFKRGSSPWDIAVELKREYPERIQLYAFVDPWRGQAAIELMQERAEEVELSGFKFYPANGLFHEDTGMPQTMLYDDREMAYPYFQKALELGIHTIAMHKAFPVGPGDLVKDRPEDVSNAAVSFPDLTFQVVHSGYAFLEDSALQLNLHPNVYANLELSASLVVPSPGRFAHILGRFIQEGAADRIIFASGAPLGHPGPVLEAITNFVMPPELVEGYGYPEITDEIKRKILGQNYLRLHGLDEQRLIETFKDDRWARERAAAAEFTVPWRHHQDRINSLNAAAPAGAAA